MMTDKSLLIKGLTAPERPFILAQTELSRILGIHLILKPVHEEQLGIKWIGIAQMHLLQKPTDNDLANGDYLKMRTIL